MLAYKTRTEWMATSQVSLDVNYENYMHQCIFDTAPDSRVLLSSSFPESTYINANYVKVWKMLHCVTISISTSYKNLRSYEPLFKERCTLASID